MANTISPNMNLIIPGVGTEQGPTYAFDINASLTLVDQHDHTPGKGVQITPAGLNIDDDLTFNSNSITDALTVVFTASTSASITPMSLSVAPGGESPQQQDLWYTPNTGVPIQITKNGAVNVVASSIDGESYAAGTFFWTQSQDALPTTPANFDIGSITLRPNVALTIFGVTLSPASAISSQYSINLPLLPVSKKILTLDSSGNMVADYDTDNVTLEVSSNNLRIKDQGVTAAKIANNTITTNQISATAGILQSQLAASAFEQSTQVVSVTGTFTVPTGVNFLTVLGSGGGGGGGGGGGRTGGAASGAGGGAGGQGSAPKNSTIIETNPGAVLVVTIGAGGIAGGGGAAGVSGTAGGTGGTTTIVDPSTSMTYTFAGGLGGTFGVGATSGAGGAGGIGVESYSATSERTGGGSGVTGLSVATGSTAAAANGNASNYSIGGAGGAGVASVGGNSASGAGGGGGAGYGVGGVGGAAVTNAVGNTGLVGAFGGGGGGGSGGAEDNGNRTGGAGGAGADGVVVFYWTAGG